LSLAYNILAGGTCIEDLDRLRTDEALLDGLGAQSIPDPMPFPRRGARSRAAGRNAAAPVRDVHLQNTSYHQPHRETIPKT